MVEGKFWLNLRHISCSDYGFDEVSIQSGLFVVVSKYTSFNGEYSSFQSIVYVQNMDLNCELWILVSSSFWMGSNCAHHIMAFVHVLYGQALSNG